jgi:hypothetical protein
MPTSIPVPDKSSGDVLTETNWDSHIRDNINKLLDRGHRVLTVAQFAALTGLEDGDEAYVEVDATNGVYWHLRYVAIQPAGRKWVFIGGPPLVSEINTSEATSSTTYVALATPGPTITLPRGGDYDVEHGCRAAAGVAEGALHSYDIGATGAADADAAHGAVVATVGPSTLVHRKRKAGLTAVALTSKYHTGGSSVTFGPRFMAVTPVRIDHAA